MILQHILDQQKHVEVTFLVNEHLTRLHLPFIPAAHAHDGPDGIVGTLTIRTTEESREHPPGLPVVWRSPYTQALERRGVEHVFRVPRRDAIRVLILQLPCHS